jgi:hypothetical protein
VIDLVAMENGGRAVSWNDASFGSSVAALMLPGRGQNMGDGWETRRRREPGNDWCVLELGAPGTVERIEVDTAFFKGNYPDRCSIQAAYVTGGTDRSITTQSMFWQTLLPEQKLQMDAVQLQRRDRPARPHHPRALQHLPRRRRVAPAPVGQGEQEGRLMGSVMLTPEALSAEAFAPSGKSSRPATRCATSPSTAATPSATTTWPRSNPAPTARSSCPSSAASPARCPLSWR